jgi:hypothetical protein
MTEALRSSETSVLRRAIRHNISEDGILHTQDKFNEEGRNAAKCRNCPAQVPEFHEANNQVKKTADVHRFNVLF